MKKDQNPSKQNRNIKNKGRDFTPEIEIPPPTKNDFESVLRRVSSSSSELGEGKKETSVERPDDDCI